MNAERQRPLLDRLAGIRALILDVDGVLTDGRLQFTEQGEEMKTFHSRDGHGIKLAQMLGIEVAIITGRSSPAVSHRARSLGIEHALLGIKDKGAAIEELAAKLDIPTAQMAVMGDDVIDLPMLSRASVSATVADAPILVRARCDWVTQRRGGNAAVREFIDMIIDARNDWSTVLAAYR